MRRLVLIAFGVALLSAFLPPANAQRGGGHVAASGGRGFHAGSASNSVPNFVRNAGSNFVSHPFSNFSFSKLASRYGSLAYLAEPFFADDLYNAGYPVAAQLPVMIVEGTAPAGTPATFSQTVSTPVQPLMIELQGDHYVRVSGDDRSGAEMVDRQAVLSSERGPDASRTDRSPSGDELPPAILVFRDGHREEVSGYTITDGALYASGNLYRDGSWNKKIELSSLSLPETIKASQERGVEFRLPTAPNEVIVRP
jgi:hypothetical protein